MKQEETRTRFALIGAGPTGLAMAKLLNELNIPWQGFELNNGVGGLWDIDGPKSTMYETAHLISSKKMTEFTDFPMDETVAEYPSHTELKNYFRNFADHFGITSGFKFETEVVKVEPIGAEGEGWQVSWKSKAGKIETAEFRGVLIANGTLSEPNLPNFKGDFAGELIHSSEYRYPGQFADKRVLIIGAGNSGCDIAVDAIHHGRSCDISMRRGYYFVPKYVFGKPADTMGGLIKLPMWLKRKIDSMILSWFVGDPQKYGFPKPDYQLYESHPIVNSLILFHAGHGDIKVHGDIDRFEGNTVHFVDGSSAEFDMIVAATGYKLHYPFIEKKLLNWDGDAPNLYMNCMHPERDDVFVLGMIEAAGLGWQGRHEQVEMVARYIKGLEKSHPESKQIQQEKRERFERLTGGMNYIDLPRMAYYVDKATYRNAVNKKIQALSQVSS
ncbi:MAG: NAD(P)-binding domain-containing protein [Rhizobiaceae bacterium]|nr:NAD(P)-binding domain-containing protein [Rhizobiaceae bacterium]